MTDDLDISGMTFHDTPPVSPYDDYVPALATMVSAPNVDASAAGSAGTTFNPIGDIR